jgi:ribosomal-protein-alanine N-acetyltransferase
VSALPEPGLPGLPHLHFRPMQAADVDAVMVVERQCYPFPWTPGNFVDSLASGYETELALEPGGALAGYRVAMVGVDEMHLLNLGVRPDLQGRGLARRLLQRLADDCRRLALPTLWLEVRPSNERALMLYRRWGFREVGLRRGYYPAAQGRREDAIVMRRAVTGHPHAVD